MKLIMLIYTAGLDYDDRLRKEVLSAQELGMHVEVVALEKVNRAGSRIVYGSTPASTIHIRSRNWFPQAKGLLLKTTEMYYKFLIQVLKRRPDIVWMHNLEMLGLIPFLILLRRVGLVKRLIWDQHELPDDPQLANKLYMSTYSLLIGHCDVVVMANEERRNYIMKRIQSTPTPIEVLQNYPDELFRQIPKRALDQNVGHWLQNTPYVLAQGGASKDRHLHELVRAIMQSDNLKLVVVGPYQKHDLEKLSHKYGENWREKVLFTGFVPQMEITPYVDHALSSVVFYTITNSNTYLCAPNRLYQALARGIPVIVGANPPMNQLVKQFPCGVVVDQDDPKSVLEGIEKIKVAWHQYHQVAIAISSKMIWNEQKQVVQSILFGEQMRNARTSVRKSTTAQR